VRDGAGARRDDPQASSLDDEACLAVAKDVLRHEAAMLMDQVERLDASFARVVGRIGAAEGRVVVTGLGKSGLIGRKIAGTLASTGTPSFFVHAAEALHGDAGMILAGDVLLALSNSGETTEVLGFARLARERGLVVIAVTGVADSSLGREADECLDIRVAREADPHDLAPTASTTVAIAIGDALSVALMTARGTDAEEFLRNHPGGSLGHRAP
jgi:arabinose-5-phosphate isomerase